MRPENTENTREAIRAAEQHECPSCGVAAGHGCLLSVGGRSAAKPHRARLRLAGVV